MPYIHLIFLIFYKLLSYNERVMKELSVCPLPIQSLLTQNHYVVSWLGQSKEYQELLGTIVNSKLSP